MDNCQLNMELEDLSVYKIASSLSDYTWEKVIKWDWFVKRTIGLQLVNAADSIGANIAEGFGRFHKKDKIKFYYNSRGSVFESVFWVDKASKRKLLTNTDYKYLKDKLDELPREINNLISLTNKNLRI